MEIHRILFTAFVFGGYLLFRALKIYSEAAHTLPNLHRDESPPRSSTWAILLSAAILAGFAYWAYPRLFH